MRRRTLLVCLLLVVAAAIPLQAKTNFAGNYTVSGNNPGVGPYTATLAITARGEVYDLVWTMGAVQLFGLGVPVGDAGLAVAYTGADKSWIGVIGYKRKADGTLDGTWAVAGRQGAPGSETAKKK